jgi:hypothetical protein
MSKQAAQLQRRVREHVVRQRAFSAQTRAEGRAELARRARRVHAFQQEIFEAGLRTVGVTYADIRARQEKDMILARRNWKKRRDKVLEHARALAKEHESLRRRRQAARARFEPRAPGSGTFLCERAAHELTYSEFGVIDVSNPEYVDGVGKNVTRWRFGISDTEGMSKACTAFAMNEFVWESDRTGTLTVQAWFHLNCVYELALEGHCFGYSEAKLQVVPAVHVAQNVAGTTDVILSSLDTTNAFIDLDETAGCEGIIEGGGSPFNGEMALAVTDFPLQAGKPVVVNAVLYMVGEGYNGGGVDFDFLSDPSLGFDVPCVALSIA